MMLLIFPNLVDIIGIEHIYNIAAKHKEAM